MKKEALRASFFSGVSSFKFQESEGSRSGRWGAENAGRGFFPPPLGGRGTSEEAAERTKISDVGETAMEEFFFDDGAFVVDVVAVLIIILRIPPFFISIICTYSYQAYDKRKKKYNQYEDNEETWHDNS